MVWLQRVYSRKAGKGGSGVPLAIEAYPLVEKPGRKCCSALTLQCVPALRLAFFFFLVQYVRLGLKSEEEEMRRWEKPKLNLHVVQSYLCITDGAVVSYT